MPLPRQLFTPAFRHQHLGRSFAVIVSIMVFIATFAVVAEALLLTSGHLWGRRAETRITVEIPAVGDEAAMSQAERVQQATTALRALPDVGLVMPLADDEVMRLLEPWFSKPDLLKSLPLPTLINVERKSGAALSVKKIQDSLKNVVSDARVDDHGTWTQDIWRLVDGLTILGGVIIALTAVALAVTVGVICRAVMAAEHETIALLHQIGAEAADIAGHFQKQAESIALRAAGSGFALAVLASTALGLISNGLLDFSTWELSHWAGLAGAALSVPVGATLIAAAAARFSVLRLIKSFP